MQTITTISLDIAKSVFQVHGVDAAGQVVIRRSNACPRWHLLDCDPRFAGVIAFQVAPCVRLSGC